MHWIALRWQPEPDAALPPVQALGWWALQFTPHVAWLDEGLLLEVSACERLWGGRRALMRQISASNPAPARLQQAQGATSLVAMARLRLWARGQRPPADLPGSLPLDTLTAAHAHLDVLARMGCRTWGEVAALPRGGLVRRFGAGLREALDVAWGERPERHVWLTLPEVFEQKVELPALATNAPELMWSANRLLAALQIWLRARQRGVLALELEWTLDLRRFNGVDLPPHQSITVRTAEPTQDMAHLRRLMGERLAHAALAAPASWLRLRSLDTAPWAGASISFLLDDQRKGDRLHELVERLSARLGPQQVRVPVAQADHRPECMQAWQPALKGMAGMKPPAGRPRGAARVAPTGTADGGIAGPGGSILPAWLLREPLRLDMHEGHPHYGGKLRRLVGPQRLEAGWWGTGAQAREDGTQDEEGGHPAVRDYYVAESPEAGLVWVYRERLAAPLAQDQAPRWYLQGLYA